MHISIGKTGTHYLKVQYITCVSVSLRY